jgi:Family of unknown function (DUF6498)
MPLFARHIARELSTKHPGLSAREIGELMRADLGAAATAEQLRLVEAVVARVPQKEAATEKPLSAWVLAAANLVPLAGVVFWGWDVFALLLLFWMENVIVGAFFILRMLFADLEDAALWIGKLFMVPFFCVHYGMFTAIHGVFVFMLFGRGQYKVDGLDTLAPTAHAAEDYGLWLPLSVLFGSHLFSFAWNYLYRGEFRRAELKRLMVQPYGRVVVLHLAIILGGMAAMALGSPMWALIVLLALKVALDFRAHVKEHSSS